LSLIVSPAMAASVHASIDPNYWGLSTPAWVLTA
jgi:hypothetical protein